MAGWTAVHDSPGNSSGTNCFLTRPSSLIYTFFFSANILVLSPLCVYVLLCGFLRWRRRPRACSSVSHSDSFTYNIALVELVGVAGNALLCAGIQRRDPDLIFAGLYPMAFTFNGQAFFHVLTCLEHYLAVVHPVPYMRLRNEGGVRIRNAANVLAWAAACALMVVVMATDSNFSVDFGMMASSLAVVSFCSLSILWALVRPAPGPAAGSGGLGAMDQPRRRAFYAILVILGVLLLRFAWVLVWAARFSFGEDDNCVLMTCDVWFYLPSSLVLPVLFLNRVGKLGCCRRPED